MASEKLFGLHATALQLRSQRMMMLASNIANAATPGYKARDLDFAKALDVDHRGLDSLDHRYLKCIAENFAGGPVGIDTIAASLSEARDALEDIVEPYLLQLGFLNRTPRGRLLTPHAFRHLGLSVPQDPAILQGVLPLGEDDV